MNGVMKAATGQGPVPVRSAGRHRNLGPLQRFLQRAGSVLLVIAALGAGNVILRYTPDVDERERPFLSGGEQGQPVEADLFTATLLKTHTAGVIKASGAVHDTQGIWVILRVRFVALEKTMTIVYAAVVDDKGRSFYASDRLRQPLVDGSRQLQPGIGVEGEVAFEIPRDATHLTAQFSNKSLERRMAAIPDITLPLDDVAWLSREPVTIEPVEVKP